MPEHIQRVKSKEVKRRKWRDSDHLDLHTNIISWYNCVHGMRLQKQRSPGQKQMKHCEVQPQHSHCAVIRSRYLTCELSFFSFHWRTNQNVKYSTVSFMQHPKLDWSVQFPHLLFFFLIQCYWLFGEKSKPAANRTASQSQIILTNSFTSFISFQNEKQSTIYPTHLIQSKNQRIPEFYWPKI